MRTILAFDDFVLNRSDNTRRVFKQPKWRRDLAFSDPANPRAIWPVSVVPAPQGGYMLMYNGVPGEDAPLAEENMLSFMAWSPDGLRFEPYTVRPGEALPHAWGVLSGENTGDFAYYDAGETDPALRYKAVHPRFTVEDGKYIEYPTYLLGSSDLVHWKRVSDSLVTPSYVDCIPSLLRNPVTGRFQVTTRRRWGERRICITESEDLRTWTVPRAVLHPGPWDPPHTHFYGMPEFYYEPGDVFIGLLLKHVMPFDEISSGPVRTEYAYSYDGLMWNRTGARLFPETARGEYGGGSDYVFSMADMGDEVVFYASAYRSEHQGRPSPWEKGMPSENVMIPGTLPKNRFVGIDSGKGMGELVTQWLRLHTPELRLNANAPFGSLKVELQDSRGPVEGYTREDFLGFAGDKLDEPLRWKGGGLEKFVEEGRWVRLDIFFEQAEVFAITGDFDFTINTRAPAYERL